MIGHRRHLSPSGLYAFSSFVLPFVRLHPPHLFSRTFYYSTCLTCQLHQQLITSTSSLFVFGRDVILLSYDFLCNLVHTLSASATTPPSVFRSIPCPRLSRVLVPLISSCIVSALFSSCVVSPPHPHPTLSPLLSPLFSLTTSWGSLDTDLIYFKCPISAEYTLRRVASLSLM
jgi:hypothetical protein